MQSAESLLSNCLGTAATTAHKPHMRAPWLCTLLPEVSLAARMNPSAEERSLSDTQSAIATTRHAMPRAQQIVVFGSAAWAVAILLIGGTTFSAVNSDARLFVGSAILATATAALGASWLAFRGHFGSAALTLVISVFAPTYFLWVINVVPLVLAAVALGTRTRLTEDGSE